MGSGLGTLETTRSGMDSNQRALQTTSHNISNLNTQGYSRQRVTMGNSTYVDILGGAGQTGLGSHVQQVSSIRNEFLDAMYRKGNMDLGYWECKTKILNDIQGLIGEPLTEGLQSVANSFWDSWQELSKDPGSLTARALVKQRGEALIRQVNYLGDEFSTIQNEIDSELGFKIEEINKITKQIAELNVEIIKIEGYGDQPNDFVDKRNNLIDKLNYYMNIETYQEPDGQISVFVSGRELVRKGVNYDLRTETSAENGLFKSIKLGFSSEVLELNGGYLKAMIDCRGDVISGDGSISNGMPNSVADIVFVVDTSDSSEDYLENVKKSITEFVSQIDRRGIDYNLRLISYDGITVTDESFAEDTSGFVNAVRDLETNVASGLNTLEPAINSLVDLDQFRDDSNKYAIVFSAESPSGDDEVVDYSTIRSQLITAGIKMSVVTDPSFYMAGAPAGEDDGWELFTTATDGQLFDITSTDFNDLFKDISDYINTDINTEISEISRGTDLLPYVLKEMNAFTNIIFREVNYLHTGGRVFTRDGTVEMAQAFFLPIDDRYPLKAGNIKINPDFIDVENISACATDSMGDNTIAIEMSKLRLEKYFSNSKGMVSGDEFYQTFILDMGTEAGEATRQVDNQGKIVQNADNNRKTISGVSLDEEMSDMLRYKFAYNAASRAFNIVDQMLDHLINKLGVR